MISELHINSAIKRKLNTELMKLYSYKATNSSNEQKVCRRRNYFNFFL